jgi:quercetin dioxygenase-like cupin family protein
MILPQSGEGDMLRNFRTSLIITCAALAIGDAVLAQAQMAPQGQMAPAAPAAPAASPVKRTILNKIEVPGANYDVITAAVEIPAGFKAGRHFHPGTVEGYVLEGEFWLALDGQPEKTFKPGELVVVPDRAVHNEGAAGDKPMKFVGIYVVERGQPLLTPVK